MTQLLEMLQYPFLVRALAAGLMVSLCAALLGVRLVLKRYSMIGDGLSRPSAGSFSEALWRSARWRWRPPWAGHRSHWRYPW